MTGELLPTRVEPIPVWTLWAIIGGALLFVIGLALTLDWVYFGGSQLGAFIGSPLALGGIFSVAIGASGGRRSIAGL